MWIQRVAWIMFGIFAVLIAARAAAFEPFRSLPDRAPIPRGNTQTADKIALGKQLFFDPRLSLTGQRTCNDCHDLNKGGDDGGRTTAGFRGRAGHRSAPSLWNVGFQTVYFWDGRGSSLEYAIKEHLMSAGAMAMPDEATLSARLDSYPEYRTEFGDVFRGNAPISLDNIAASLASYLRTLVTPNSPFDRYLGGEAAALTPSAARGFHQFVETGCASCHFWVNMAGPVPGLAFGMGEGFYELFPNFVGSPYDARYHLMDEMGRYAVTQNEAHRHLWRVASLRNIALTAPYFHNGSVATLAEAVRVMARTELNQELGPAEVDDIVSFLHSLTGEHPTQTAPPLP